MRFVLIISNTYKKASGTLDTIKKEIRDNEMILKHYQIKITRDAEGDSIFKHQDGHLIRVLCKGAEQIGSVRGEKFGAYRPDLIIIDDLEDDELVKNPIRRRELCDLYDEALIPAGEKGKVKVLAIGTILHDDSLMAKLVSSEHYPEYHKLFYKALIETQGQPDQSLWEDKWTVDWLHELKRKKPSVFAKEYQNDPSYGILGVFSKDNFRRWSIENNKYVLFNREGGIRSYGNLSDCKAAIACDLAWEEKRESDYTVIMPGYLTPKSDLLVDTYVCKKGLKPHEIEEILFEMEARLKQITGNTVPIGFEKAKLEKVVKWLLQQAMKKCNYFLTLKDLQWDSDKIGRIETRLESRYSQHVIYHRYGMGDLESQLLRVRSAIHDDLPDALQGLVQLLQEPKTLRKKGTETENEFNWWRQQAINARKPKRNRYVFGSRGTSFTAIPAQIAYR